MGNIVFIMYPYSGPVNASFKLAKRLKDKGHNITYVGVKEIESQIAVEGFDFYCLDARFNLSIPEFSTLYHIISNRKKLLNHHRIQNALFLKRTTEMISKLSPDLALIDVDIIPYAFAFHKFKVPFLLLTTTVVGDKSLNVPPYFSKHMPSKSVLSIIKSELIWYRWLIKHRLFIFIQSLLLKGNGDSYQRLSELFGFPIPLYRKANRPWAIGFTHVPELILYPKEFDLPRAQVTQHYYIGPWIDLKRKELTFKDSFLLSDDKDLIYCSLGSMPHLLRENYIDFIHKVIAAFSSSGNYNLIISLGKAADKEMFHSLPAHIYVYNYAPQIAILNKAKLMITHGGLNSLKECILTNTPMLVYPLSKENDQNGTAVRVAFHKLGLRGDIEQDTQEEILGKCNLILKDPQYRQNISKFYNLFNQCIDQESHHIDFIESFIK